MPAVFFAAGDDISPAPEERPAGRSTPDVPTMYPQRSGSDGGDGKPSQYVGGLSAPDRGDEQRP